MSERRIVISESIGGAVMRTDERLKSLEGLLSKVGQTNEIILNRLEKLEAATINSVKTLSVSA